MTINSIRAINRHWLLHKFVGVNSQNLGVHAGAKVVYFRLWNLLCTSLFFGNSFRAAVGLIYVIIINLLSHAHIHVHGWLLKFYWLVSVSWEVSNMTSTPNWFGGGGGLGTLPPKFWKFQTPITNSRTVLRPSQDTFNDSNNHGHVKF